RARVAGGDHDRCLDGQVARREAGPDLVRAALHAPRAVALAPDREARTVELEADDAAASRLDEDLGEALELVGRLLGRGGEADVELHHRGAVTLAGVAHPDRYAVAGAAPPRHVQPVERERRVREAVG